MGKQVKQLLRQELGDNVSITFNAFQPKNAKEPTLSCWLSKGRKGISLSPEDLEAMTNALVANFGIIVEGYVEAKELLDEGYDITFGEASIESNDPEPRSVQQQPTKVVSFTTTKAVSPAKASTKAKPSKPKAEKPKESPQARLASLQQARASLNA